MSENADRLRDRALAVAPLDGIVVVDFTSMMAGPFSTRLMADQGADVIKVEDLRGDHMRNLRPRLHGESRFFGQLNVGKRSVALNLKDPRGHQAALALVARADVVVEAWRPGVAAKLGLGYDDCRLVNNRVVYLSISGYGQTGPDARRAAFAPVVHAASGYDMANLPYQPAGSAPPTAGVFVGDMLGGTMGFASVLTALRRRDLAGAGAHIDLSLMDSMLSMLVYEVQAAHAGLTETRVSHPPLRTVDGFVAVTVVNNANWAAMARAMGRPELAEDERFVDIAVRTNNWGEMQRLMAEWAAPLTTAVAEARLSECGVPAARYRTAAELLDDEHLRERQSFPEVIDRSGAFPVIATPFRLDDLVTPAAGARVPGLGEHTREVLGQFAGRPEDEVEGLLNAGVAKASSNNQR